MASAQTLLELHIGEGGLLRRAERAAHLTSLHRQTWTALAITWLPLVVLGLLTELITGRREPILRDVSVHVRLLVAAPVFLLVDQWFTRDCRRIVGQLVADSFVPAAEEPRFDRLLRGARWLADAALPELFLAVLAVALGIAALLGVVPIGGLTRGSSLSAAQLWYALVDWPFFQFLLWRSLWRWAIWVRILVGLSRIDLTLVPNHPDRRGGISFLSQPSVRYCAMFLFAVSSVLCAEWGYRFTYVSLRSFEPLALAFALGGSLLAFGPLLLFTPRLERARLAGLDECGSAATEYGRRLRRQWLETREIELSVGINTAHVGEIYREAVDRLRPILVTVHELLLLLVATLLPMVPLMLAHIPAEDWRVLMKMVTGGRLP